MNLDALQSFVVFSELLNFTRAAEALHISQPALHTKVGRLAESLGTPLYRRVGRRLELTPAGVEAARFGRETAERTAAFVRELRDGPSPDAVVLAAGEGSYLFLLDDAIRRFRRESRALLRLLTRDAAGVVDDVRAGRAHLGVLPLDTPLEGIRCDPIARVGQALVLPRRHALARPRSLALADLQGERLIVPPPDRPFRQALGRALQSAGVEWEVAVEATGWPLILHFVSLGLGLAVVNEFCRVPAGLVARPIADLPAVRYFVIHRTGAAVTGEAARLRSILRAVTARRGGSGETRQSRTLSLSRRAGSEPR
jgi:DNA-binding transcriptional LysR family regulator